MSQSNESVIQDVINDITSFRARALEHIHKAGQQPNQLFQGSAQFRGEQPRKLMLYTRQQIKQAIESYYSDNPKVAKVSVQLNGVSQVSGYSVSLEVRRLV